MNVDAAMVHRYLEQEPVGRYPATIARRLGIDIHRVRGALLMLEAVGKVKRYDHGTWTVI